MKTHSKEISRNFMGRTLRGIIAFTNRMTDSKMRIKRGRNYYVSKEVCGRDEKSSRVLQLVIFSNNLQSFSHSWYMFFRKEIHLTSNIEKNYILRGGFLKPTKKVHILVFKIFLKTYSFFP